MAYRVLIAQFMHETNTFSKLKTTLEDYRKRWLIEGEAMVPRFTGTKNEVGGYIDAVKTYGWEPVWAAAANATPSGKLTKETWEHIRDLILDAAKKAGKLDAICLSLHGAAVTETEDDAEGALLEALRAIVGPDVPIVATLDLHANATAGMARHANALVSYRTYPHIDGYERAVQAAALVQETLEGRKKPRCLLVQPAMLQGADSGKTTQPGLMRDLLAKADAFEKEPGINVVSIQAGFTWSDIPYTGPSIAVSHEPGAEKRAREMAAALLDEIWKRRDENTSNYRPIADAIAAARAGVGKDGPLVVADGTDNPGGGGYNDTTPVLQALIDADVRNVAFGTIFDPGTVQQAIAAGVGAEIDVVLGGHTDPSMGGPVKARAIVKMLSDGSFKNDGPMNAGVETSMGPTAVLRIGGIDVVTISNRIQTIDLQVFLSQGIDPRTKSVVAVKSVQHFRAAYAPIAREIVLVDSGGICSPDLSRLKFTKLRRPIWPLDGVNDPYAGAAAMNVVREAPLPGASFGATLRLDGDAARIVAAAEADPGALPAALADAKGLLLIQGMNGVAADPNLLIRLSRVFGPEVEDYRHNLTDLKAVHVSVPEILLVSNRPPVGKAPPKRPDPPLAADGLIPTQYPHRKGWHTDQSYRRPPPDISLFYAVTPAERTTGQTLFANGILAYEALPPALKAKVESLVGLHAQPGSGRSRDAALAGRTPRAFAVHERSQPQPVVRIHPVTGEKSLFLCEWGQMDWFEGPFVGLEPGPHGAGAALLDEIMAHYTQRRFCYAHEWTEGDLLVWDNRCLVHAATWFDGDRESRLMWRTTVHGNPGAHYAGEKKSWVPAAAE